MTASCYEKTHARQPHVQIDDTVCLDFDKRSKSRGKAVTEDGTPISWFLDRGESLLEGDLLKSDDGRQYEVKAAAEPVSKVTAGSPHLLMRAAYHLGNRHVALSLSPETLCYQPDHVLDEMVTRLGLTVERCELPFQPEDGAYHGGHHHD